MGLTEDGGMGSVAWISLAMLWPPQAKAKVATALAMAENRDQGEAAGGGAYETAPRSTLPLVPSTMELTAAMAT